MKLYITLILVIATVAKVCNAATDSNHSCQALFGVTLSDPVGKVTALYPGTKFEQDTTVGAGKSVRIFVREPIVNSNVEMKNIEMDILTTRGRVINLAVLVPDVGRYGLDKCGTRITIESLDTHPNSTRECRKVGKLTEVTIQRSGLGDYVVITDTRFALQQIDASTTVLREREPCSKNKVKRPM